MATTKKNILAEALADSKTLKNAALANATSILIESMKNDLKEMVEDQMNEMAGDEEVTEEINEETDMKLSENEDMDLDFSDEDEDVDLDEESEDEDEDEDVGLSESDLQEALMSALNEVDHGGLGDLEEVGPEDHPDPATGADSKEQGFEEKTAPAAKDFTVKESKYKKQVAELVKENTLLKKANNKLKSAVNEVNLFNTKLAYAQKLMKKEGLDVSTKKAIVARFDKVKTIAEAKTLYESLQLALGALSETNKKSVKKQNSLSEALGVHGSPQGKNVSKVQEPVVLKEVSAFDPARMKILAGIK